MQSEKLEDWLDRVIENKKELNSLTYFSESISISCITDNEIMLMQGVENISSALDIPLTYGKPFLSDYEKKMKRKISFFYNGFIFSGFIYAESDRNKGCEGKEK